MENHTPGPWLIYANNGYLYIEADQGKKWRNPTICHLYEDVTPFDSVLLGDQFAEFDNAKANAHLIAAAPELLEALRGLLNAPDPEEVEDHAPKLRAIMNAHSAIAKATGGAR